MQMRAWDNYFQHIYLSNSDQDEHADRKMEKKKPFEKTNHKKENRNIQCKFNQKVFLDRGPH